MATACSLGKNAARAGGQICLLLVINLDEPSLSFMSLSHGHNVQPQSMDK